MEPLTFAEILALLTRADYVRMADQPVNEAEMILASILPEIRKASYEAKRGSIKVIPTMAGETGNDSPYVPTGDLELDAWSQALAKFSAIGFISENAQIEFQQMRDQLLLRGTTDAAATYTRNFLINWMETWVREAFRQQNEYLRGQALGSGQLVLRGGIVDLGVPAENRKAFTGLSAFGGSESKFWQAIRWGDRQVGAVRARLLSWDTLDEIMDNNENSIAIVDEQVSGQGNVKRVRIRKLVNNGQAFSSDTRDSTTLVAYKGRGKIKLPDGTLQDVAYFPDKTLSFVGNNQTQQVAEDGTVTTREALGYTHVGPTVPGNGRPGVWMNGRVPEGRPYHVITEGEERVMTVIEEPKKLAIATTE